ncbi:MAG: diacylglycerol kinase family lipid kinase [Deltaproteobacteria bacterium]|nr:diacylglycerol kinase family lipid kinase [Deltaproteobacteria bacterium]
MAAKPKPFVILNTKAAGGVAGRLWPWISEELEKEIGPFDFEETQKVGHGRTLAKEAVEEGSNLIIACGGDGTIHEVANGIYEARTTEKPTLGILCLGTGGDLIKTLGISKNIPDQIKVIASQKTKRIDLGLCEYLNEQGKKEKRVFINVADVGLGADVCRRVAHSRSFFGRKLAYLAASLRAFASWRPKKIEIVTEHLAPGFWPETPLIIAIANGRYFGGGMPIAPSANLSDGYFDLMVVGPLKAAMAPVFIPLLYSKQILRLPQARFDRVNSILIKASEEAEVGLELDGEPVGFLPASFNNIPQAIEVLVP